MHMFSDLRIKEVPFLEKLKVVTVLKKEYHSSQF